MRHYLYIWHDPAERMLVASGIEFKDVIPALLDADGIVLRTGSAGDAQESCRLPNLGAAAIASAGA